MNLLNDVLKELHTVVCDSYCKYPYECENEEQIQCVCENCMVSKYLDTISKEIK